MSRKRLMSSICKHHPERGGMIVQFIPGFGEECTLIFVKNDEALRRKFFQETDEELEKKAIKGIENDYATM
jgi:hypothetical protein